MPIIRTQEQADAFRLSLNKYESFRDVKSVNGFGRKWNTFITLKVKFKEKQLKQFRIITQLILVLTLGIAKCFKCFRERLKTLKTKEKKITAKIPKDCDRWPDIPEYVKKALIKLPELHKTPLPTRTLTSQERDQEYPLNNDVLSVLNEYLPSEDLGRVPGFDPTLLPKLFEVRVRNIAKSFDRFFEIVLIDETRFPEQHAKLKKLSENIIYQSLGTEELENNKNLLKTEILEILITLDNYELKLFNDLFIKEAVLKNLLKNREKKLLEGSRLKEPILPLEQLNLIEIAQEAKQIIHKQKVFFHDVKYKKEKFIILKALEAGMHGLDPEEIPDEFPLEKIFARAIHDSTFTFGNGAITAEIGGNLEMMLQLASFNPRAATTLAQPTLLKNKQFAAAVLKKDGKMLVFFHDEIRNNLELVKIAVRQNREAIDSASERLQKHPEIKRLLN